MKIRIIIIAFFVIWGMSKSIAQDITSPTVIPQSPEAATLSKYSEYPAGTFTGIPGISVPLYTIASGDIQIPIALNYHAGGFRVSEEASMVGLGWSISTTSAITRSIIGADDFKAGITERGLINQSYHSSFAPKMIDIVSGTCEDDGMDFPSCTGFNNFELGNEYIGAYSAGPSNFPLVDGEFMDYSGFIGVTFDWEPDIYSINCFENTGKFVFETDQTLHFLDKKDLKVAKTASGWEAKSNDGYIYLFELESSTINAWGSEVSGEWYLTKIISPLKNEMIFSYHKSVNLLTQYSYSEYAYATIADPPHSPWSENSSPLGVTRHEQVYLDSIIFNEGYVKFEYETNEREDLKNAQALQKIDVYDFNDQLIKEFEFVTSYFDTNNLNQGYLDGFSSADYEYYTKRLKLDSVIERNGSTYKAHTFNYSSQPLPNKDSFDQDHWGYYNGAENYHLIPSFEGELDFQDAATQGSIIEYKDYVGANREPNDNYINACILEEIIYPTGGSTSFEFEGNEYVQIENSFQYEYFEKSLRKNGSSSGDDIFYGDSDPFNFPANTIYTVDTEIDIVVYSTGTQNISMTSNMWIDISYNSGSSKRYYFDQLPLVGTDSYSLTDNLGTITGPVQLDIHIEESNEDRTAIVVFSCQLKKNNIGELKKCGGLRVKKIVNFDGTDHNNDIVKTYHYEENGILKSPLHYHTAIFQAPTSKYQFTSSNIIQLSHNQGSYIGYSKVIENFGLNGELGKIEYVYHNSPNVSFIFSLSKSGVPSSSRLRFDGKLKERNTYDQASILKEKIEYTYEMLDETIIKGFHQTAQENPTTSTWGIGSFHYYPIYSRWEALTEQKTSLFDAAGEAFVTNSFNFYEDGNYRRLSKRVVEKSDGKYLVSVLRYPEDFNFTVCTSAKAICESDYYDALIACQSADDNCTNGGIDQCDMLYQECMPYEYNCSFWVKMRIAEANGCVGDSINIAWACKGAWYGCIRKVSDECVPDRVACFNQVNATYPCQENFESCTQSQYDLYDNESKIIIDLQEERPNTLIESITYLYDNISRIGTVSSKLHIYNKFSNDLILPAKTLVYESANINNDIELAGFENQELTFDSNYKDKIEFKLYDERGNILEYENLTSGISTTFIWGYNQSYPIAKIENATYSDIEGLSGFGVGFHAGNGSLTIAQESTLYSAPELSNTLITNYEYKPSVGVISQTDPNGVTTYYEYDDFGRLKSIKDENGNIVQHNKYHYKDQ